MDNADREPDDEDIVDRAQREFADLVARMKAGSRAAEEEFVREYGWCLRIIIRQRLRHGKLRSRCRPSDVFQETMFGVVQAVRSSSYQPVDPEDLVERLARVAEQNIIDHCRSHTAARRDVRREDPRAVESLELPAREMDPSEQAAYNDFQETLLKRVGLTDRRILTLQYAGATWAEIARQVGGTVDSVRMRAARCRQKLDRLLGRWHDSSEGAI